VKEICENVREICLKWLNSGEKPGPALFDKIIDELAASGIEIDQQDTDFARHQLPAAIAIFMIEGDKWFVAVTESDVDLWNDTARSRVLDKAKDIGREALKSAPPNDPTLFDRITAQIAAAGGLIDQAATATVRTRSPNIVAVYSENQCPEELVYLEISGENIENYSYRDDDDVYVDLTPTNKVEVWYETLTSADLAGLRFIERDGQRWYDSSDLDRKVEQKEQEKSARREAMRTVTFTLPDEFLELCEEVNQTPEVILRGFIADLCDLRERPYCTNGSDERDLAERYFERCGYRFMAKIAKEETG